MMSESLGVSFQGAPKSMFAKRLRVLVVEDEALIAMLVEDMLTDLGHEVAAVASRMDEALKIARVGLFDLAILDVNLDGKPSFPIADLLATRGIPFAFSTGYGLQGRDSKYSHIPTLSKPFVSEDLAKLVSHVWKHPDSNGPKS
jgi:CheY-like chemotaxis protein